jgi:hypothetical protein
LDDAVERAVVDLVRRRSGSVLDQHPRAAGLVDQVLDVPNERL